jgi:iron complex outermembrane recepter protein
LWYLPLRNFGHFVKNARSALWGIIDMKLRKAMLGTAAACVSALLFWDSPVMAQGTQATERGPVTELGEIIVTARKREESLLNVPVIETALSADTLKTLQVRDMADLPNLVPGLQFGRSVLSIGSAINLRGVGSSSTDPGVDSSVALNIDGLSLGNSLTFTSGMFDLAQVEVLKGPQALFYGKASPAGVIALRTADPTDKFELIARAAYEREAREPRGEIIVSGPVSDTLKLRFAGMYAAPAGFFNQLTSDPANVLSAFGAAPMPYDRESRQRNYQGRVTVLWNPTAKFDTRLKLNFVHDRAIDPDQAQLVSCPEGAGFAPLGFPFIGKDDCVQDRNMRTVAYNPADFPGIPNNGVPYTSNTQRYATLELNYRTDNKLTLTSTTAYYKLGSDSMLNTIHSTYAPPPFSFENRFSRRQLTEEVRVNSDFSGKFNFTGGVFYENGHISDEVVGRTNIILIGLGLPFPPLVANGTNLVDIKTYSAFAQGRWKLTPQLELAAGARWTDEKRSIEVINLLTGSATPYQTAVPVVHPRNTVPEVTLTYKPTDDRTYYAAYKQGLKSGSFSIATISLPSQNNAFGDEKVKGGEIGMKARLVDRKLLLNIAAYYYKFSGLQVGGIEPAPGGIPVIHTVNAGAARTVGVDFDVAYLPASAPGLQLNAAINYNRARYTLLNNVPCYGGQTIAMGCNQILNTVSNLYTAQDLSGTPMIRAPDYQTTVGATYDFALARDYRMTLTASSAFSSKYVTWLAVGRPSNDNYQSDYVKTDLSAALKSPGAQWETALIVKNISNKLIGSNCSNSNYAGGLLAQQKTGDTTNNPVGIDQVGCYTDPGRQIWLRLSWMPFASRQ